MTLANGMPGICLRLIMTGLLATGSLWAASGATGGVRVSCIVMGDSVTAPYNPFTSLFMQDPLFTYSLYPLPHAGDEEKRRLDRVYYPRTYDLLVGSYDVMIFRDARVTHFSPRQFADLERAFREGGMVSVAAHSLSWNDAWLPTVLYDLSPISEYLFRFSGGFRVRFRREREPVFQPFIELGMERISGWEYGVPTAKEGATVWADLLPRNAPWLVSWRPGGTNAGLQWAFADKFDTAWWGTAPGSRDSNPYALDFATSLLLYSIGRDPITNIHARRQARQMLSSFQAQKLLILSVLDWAEKFGADVYALSDRLVEMEAEAGDAVDRYLEQDYDYTISFMEEVATQVDELTARALEEKDRALFWVYVSEWMAVTSIAMVAGVVLWNLMVKRRMYRTVRATRLSASDLDL